MQGSGKQPVQMSENWEKTQGGQAMETAERLLKLIYDLGSCQDSKQILVTACRHFHVLFDEFLVFGLLLGDPQSDSFRMLSVENRYVHSWGGITQDEIPENTDTDEILRLLGKDVTNWMHRDKAMVEAFIERDGSFVETNSPVSVRLASLTGADCQTFMVGEWGRPGTEHKAWTILGYKEAREIPRQELDMFTTVVETASRMAYYPSLVSYLDRTHRVNQSVRRNIVHDLKTPITVIKGYGETLSMKDIRDDDEMATELIDGILDGCDRLLEDIRDILEPIEDAWKPEYSKFDLSMLLHRVVLAESHTDRARSHQLFLEGADEPFFIRADFRKLRRAFENLLSNAVKYSPGEDKNVTVSLYFEDGEIKVAFTDEGLGMSESQLSEVMKHGGRVVDSSLGIEGSGFGLTSTIAVLQAHGGRLDGLSTPGIGTTFTAVFPDSLAVSDVAATED